MEKGKNKGVRLGTQATQAARDHHPPWPRKKVNNTTDSQPMVMQT
jgi:hypothetical protein